MIKGGQQLPSHHNFWLESTHTLQTTYDNLASSDESDAAFEGVDLEPPLPRVDAEVENEKPFHLDFSRTSGQAEIPSVQRRKPATTAEKRFQLDIHK